MFAGGFIEKIGHKKIVLFGIPWIGLTEIGVTLAPSIYLFFGFWTLCGIAIGMLEIVLNVEADRTEQMVGFRVMNRSHAFWSFGFFTAGLVGAGTLQMGISSTYGLIAVNIFAWVATWVVFIGFKPTPERNKSAEPASKFVRPSLGILTLVAFTLSAMLLEGASADWSVIFMQENFRMPAFVNGMAFAIGALAQAITRFFADGYIDKFGP